MKLVKRIGKTGINTSFVINKSFFKRIINGGCQDEIDKEIEDINYSWIQLKEVLQFIPNKGISTILAKISTRDVVIKIQEADKAKKEYEIQDKIKDFKGVIIFECLFYCEGDKKYIETFSVLKEYERLCRVKGVSMGIILMPYYKNKSLDKSLSVDKIIIEDLLKNYCVLYNETGFIHGDFFPKNIIIDDDNNPLLIDFENSYFNGTHIQFWRDLSDFFSTVKYHKNLNDIVRNHCMMNGAYNKKPSIELITKLIDDL